MRPETAVHRLPSDLVYTPQKELYPHTVRYALTTVYMYFLFPIHRISCSLKTLTTIAHTVTPDNLTFFHLPPACIKMFGSYD